MRTSATPLVEPLEYVSVIPLAHVPEPPFGKNGVPNEGGDAGVGVGVGIGIVTGTDDPVGDGLGEEPEVGTLVGVAELVGALVGEPEGEAVLVGDPDGFAVGGLPDGHGVTDAPDEGDGDGFVPLPLVPLPLVDDVDGSELPPPPLLPHDASVSDSRQKANAMMRFSIAECVSLADGAARDRHADVASLRTICGVGNGDKCGAGRNGRDSQRTAVHRCGCDRRR